MSPRAVDESVVGKRINLWHLSTGSQWVSHDHVQLRSLLLPARTKVDVTHLHIPSLIQDIETVSMPVSTEQGQTCPQPHSSKETVQPAHDFAPSVVIHASGNAGFTEQASSAYPCRNCGKMLNHAGSVTRHQRKCEGVFHLKCEVCGQGFYRRDRLNGHRRREHGLAPLARGFSSSVEADGHDSNIQHRPCCTTEDIL